MKRYAILVLKILGGVVGALLVVLVIAAVVLNNGSVQNHLKDYAVESLSEHLETNVRVDSVSIDFLTFDVNLLGVAIDDRQHRQMLQADALAVNLDLWGLLRKDVKISKAHVEGLRARLYKPEEGPANFQFVLDAFKSNKPKKKKNDQQKADKKKFKLDVNDVKIAHIDIIFNEDTFMLEGLDYSKSLLGSEEGHIRHLHGKIDMVTKKGPQTMHADIGALTLEGDMRCPKVKIDSLHFALDNHLPRKNEGKPHRGWFDPGHLDVVANMELKVNHYGKDTVNVSLTRFEATDSLTGFNVKDLRCRAGINLKQAAYLTDITVQQDSTLLTFDSATVVLPSKKLERHFAFNTSKITGHTLLRDISRPFALALKNFTQPLELTVLFSGTDTTLTFRDIHVWTDDKRFDLKAEGGINHLNKSKELDIHFHVSDMHTTALFAEEIISMFTVKKLMIKQMKNLGNISYTGDVSILYKKEAFKGLLRTAAGALNFDFYIDENDKYIIGNATTSRFQLGEVLDMKDIRDVSLKKGSFKVDIQKERTLAMRRKHGGSGKLPIGSLNAIVGEAGYKGIKVTDLIVACQSNGAQLEGNISQQNKGLDWACDFSIADLDKMSTLRVKPKVKIKVKDIIPTEKIKKKFNFNIFKKKKKDKD